MVATWNPAAASSYYTRRRETDYYTKSREPEGVWYAPGGDFGLVDGQTVDPQTFQRLYAAVDEHGRSLLEKIRRHAERTPAFDVTFSAPRSVSLAWGFAPPDVKAQIEVAQQRAVRAALDMIEREAVWARRGRNGDRIEQVRLSAAMFQQGESRAAKHSDGAIFGDANLHTHAVCLNIATRADGTIGGLHSKVLRDFKMAAGAFYHAALAFELTNSIGFEINCTENATNGIFELVGVDKAVIRYFSARRNEIENELSKYGLTSDQAVALAAAITRGSRSSKRPHTRSREEIWVDAARSLGVDVERFTTSLIRQERSFDPGHAERLLADRLAALPAALTEHESVIDRRELVRSVAASFVGTGLSIERAEHEVKRLLRDGAFIEIGRDPLGLPRYSTPEIIKIEREVVTLARELASRSWQHADKHAVDASCRAAGLSAEQVEAVRAAVDASAIGVIEGAPGVGKSATLASISSLYRAAGCRVLGTATAWRVATALKKDLGIDSRATASWIASIKLGQEVFDERSILICDEAGLLSSREMHVLLDAVARSHAKLLLVGDRRQLQAIGAGPGLDLVIRAVDAARIDTIVRQRKIWAREAVANFGAGRAADALSAFAERGLLIEAHGAKAAVAAVIEHADRARARHPSGTVLILAKSNAAVAEISREIRNRRKAARLITGKEVSFTAATPSGHDIELQLAQGDMIRFLVRNDDLGVINSSIGKVLKIRQRGENKITITADIGSRSVSFDPMVLADQRGRPRIGWAYASTIAGAQGMTVDEAVMFLDAACNRHDVYVAASRARDTTTLVYDTTAIDRRLVSELPLDQQGDNLEFSDAQRREWLAERVSRASPKISTLDVIEPSQSIERVRDRSHQAYGVMFDR